LSTAMEGTRVTSVIVRCFHLIFEMLSRSHVLGVSVFDVSMRSHRRVFLVKVLLCHCFTLAMTCVHW
jgi:hypothetical protein